MSEENWLEALPEPMRDLPFISKSKSMDEAINHIKDAADTMGNSIRIPSQNAGPDDMKRFQERVLEKFPTLMPVPDPDDTESYAKVLERLGAPADPGAYKLPEIEDFEWPEDFVADLQKKAQAAGMTKKQFAEYAKQVGSDMRDRSLTSKQAHEQRIAELRKEWGEAFDSRKQQVLNYLEQTEAPAGLREAVKNGTADPATLRWIHAALAKGKESTEGLDQGGPDGGSKRLTPDEAKAEIAEILNNPEYFKSGPRQQILMKRMIELQKFANPG